MTKIQSMLAAAVFALPVMAIGAMTAEASPRGHSGGYSNHASYNKFNGYYGRRDHGVRRKSWYGRMHASRRHGGGWRAH
jgi:hypothetical protein